MGTMLVHFPGIGHDVRAEAMDLWLDKLDHTPKALNVPLVNTSYPAETMTFWSQIGFAMEIQAQASNLKEVRNVTFDALDKAEGDLSSTIQEEAYNKEKMKAMIEGLQRVIMETRDQLRHQAEETNDEQ